MPQIITQSWGNGPMGPGFLVMFRRNIPEFFDGGPMNALLTKKKDDKAEKQKREDELFAVVMLMREQV